MCVVVLIFNVFCNSFFVLRLEVQKLVVLHTTQLTRKIHTSSKNVPLEKELVKRISSDHLKVQKQCLIDLSLHKMLKGKHVICSSLNIRYFLNLLHFHRLFDVCNDCHSTVFCFVRFLGDWIGWTSKKRPFQVLQPKFCLYFIICKK